MNDSHERTAFVSDFGKNAAKNLKKTNIKENNKLKQETYMSLTIKKKASSSELQFPFLEIISSTVIIIVVDVRLSFEAKEESSNECK